MNQNHPGAHGLDDWRQRFPFTIAAPSWVLALEDDNFVGNVRFLANRVDKVQILCFGRDFVDELLSPGDLRRLTAIRAETGLRYSVHLPADLDLLEPRASQVEQAAKLDLLARVFDLTACLQPDNCILHLDSRTMEPGTSPQVLGDLAADWLTAILARFPGQANQLQVENTNWDLRLAKQAILASGCGICADFGHLAHHGHSISAFLEVFGQSIGELHLHGFDPEGDHLALISLAPELSRPIMAFVQNYGRSVTVENFRADWLQASLGWLEQALKAPSTKVPQ